MARYKLAGHGLDHTVGEEGWGEGGAQGVRSSRAREGGLVRGSRE